MQEKNQDNLKSFLFFLKEHSNSLSEDEHRAKEFLKEQGEDPEAFAKALIKKIKKAKLLKEANKSEKEFGILSEIRKAAAEKAKQLLSTPGFSLLGFMKQENFSFQNRNLENLDEHEIQNVLEGYLFLKMQQNKKEQ
jgi:hypothetical protein